MLHSVHIQDLALIERAEVAMSAGLNVVSGETGGGKSLLITALKLLRGEKARADLVRRGAPELRVDGEFHLGEGERSRILHTIVEELTGAPLEDDCLILTRIVDARGRSRVRIGGRPATLSALRELGPWLLEIHGQGDSRALMRAEIQAEILDAFAGTTALRRRFADALAAARRTSRELDEVRAIERDRLQRVEFLRYQVEEMERLGLGDGELEVLEREHTILAHQDQLRALLEDALDALQDAETSASDRLGGAERCLAEAAAIDPSLAEAQERVQDAVEHVSAAVRVVQSGAGRVDLDPARLVEVEERLAEVRRALKRFGPTEQDYAANLERARGELTDLEDGCDPESLQARLAVEVRDLAGAGRRLVRARKKAAERFSASVAAELGDLGMDHTRLRVDMATVVEEERLIEEANAHGPSPVDFAVCINPGEPFRSMRETASGGEMARIVLAVKKTLADQDRVPLLVLDEVDAEIGGRLGLSVGAKLAEVAAHHQVVIVTHLPQVAAFADNHLLVRKVADAARTHSTVEVLGPTEVERELAAMAAGEGADATSLAEARRLVGAGAPGRAPIAAFGGFERLIGPRLEPLAAAATVSPRCSRWFRRSSSARSCRRSGAGACWSPCPAWSSKAPGRSARRGRSTIDRTGPVGSGGARRRCAIGWSRRRESCSARGSSRRPMATSRCSSSTSTRARRSRSRVHPDDEAARAEKDWGKLEAWVVLDVDDDGRIIRGFKPGATVERFREIAHTSEVESLLHAFRPEVGDVVFVPPGTVHAIGPGVVVYEIQQNSDVTYRLYDWGRPREVHVEKALGVTVVEPHAGDCRPIVAAEPIDERSRWLIRTPRFRLREFASSDAMTLPGEGAVKVLSLIQGRCTLGWLSGGEDPPLVLQPGDSVLVPACCGDVFVSPRGAGSTLLGGCRR